MNCLAFIPNVNFIKGKNIKTINKNKYENIFIISNGHENPVVDELLKLYPKIKYLHCSVEYDMSIIINGYNFIIPVSTFSYNLIS